MDAYVDAARQYNLGDDEVQLRQEVCRLLRHLQAYDFHRPVERIVLAPDAARIAGGKFKLYKFCRFLYLMGGGLRNGGEGKLWMLPPCEVARLMQDHPSDLVLRSPGGGRM